MSLTLDGTTITSLDNAYPGASHTIKFTVKNTGTLTTTYALNIIDVINTFYEGYPTDLVYSITSTNNGGIVSETQVPGSSDILISSITIDSGVTQEYTMTIHFKETGDDQNDNQGKKFSGKIQINNVGESQYLSAKIMAENTLITTTPNNISGLYSSEDNDGTTYYFRGNISNNYVRFANDLWRIVRINGDKSIRLILDEKLDNPITYIEDSDSAYEKFVGYSYDNSYPCDGYFFCDNYQGTPSTIKDYLENTWYQDVIKSTGLDSKISESGFCNDTLYTDTSDPMGWIKNFNGQNRLTAPSFKYSGAIEKFGGYYKLKVGLLSMDEASMAGLNSISSYLSKSYDWWLMTPYRVSYSWYAEMYIAGNGKISTQVTFRTSNVRPVINLKSNTIYLAGNGTQDNPYQVS